MKRLVVILLALSTLWGHAGLSLVSREPFVGGGILTPSSPGANFSAVTGTLTQVPVGARPSSVAAPGWSADMRVPSTVQTGVMYDGALPYSDATGQYGMFGVWVRLKSYPAPDGYAYVIKMANRYSSGYNYFFGIQINSAGQVIYGTYGGGTTTTSTVSIALNTWTFVALGWQNTGTTGNNFSYSIAVQPLGGTWTSVVSGATQPIYDSYITHVAVGLDTSGYGAMLRISCPSLYTMASFADFAYPSDIIAPVEQANCWYVNTATGNDASDGSTPATAWKTADKITTESQYCGMVGSNAAGPGNGDILTIDTSGAPLVIDTNTLTFATQGLKVQPVSGQVYIKCQAEEFMANTGFTLAAGLAKTYQTTDTQANVVAWENDEWMFHVKSASYGASAAVTNLQNNTTINYPTTGAALDATPGSFYTDGTNLYIHPFGDTNPAVDGQTYTRSINRGGGLSAVEFTAGNFRAIGFNVRKTALVDANDGDFGAYCFQDGVEGGSGFSNSVEGGYFSYGDKHCFGSTSGDTDSTLLVLNTECEQGQPYCSFGGQSPFVSYSDATTADNVDVYRGCTCLTRSGLVGSTAGDPVGTGGDIILSHNAGTGTSFASITLDDCNFASGTATMGASTNLVVTNQTQIAGVNTYCPTTTIQETTFPYQLVAMESGATQLTVKNCLIKPVFVLSPAPAYFGFLVAGNVTIEGCTFDLSGITGNSLYYFQQGMIQRTGALNLTFRNNAYLVPSTESLPLLYNATSSDTLTFDHNAYNLGGGSVLMRSYTGPSSTADLTFAQWQALGRDCTNSSLNADLQLQNDAPLASSPLINGGADLGAMADFTGTSYAHRNTIGAYQGNGSYLAPQSISKFPPLQTVTTDGGPITLPSTTTAGLALTYALVSGPATLSGDSLTLTGTGGTVTLVATQAGSDTYAPLSETETLTAMVASTDSPTMPWWDLVVLAAILGGVASRGLKSSLG